MAAIPGLPSWLHELHRFQRLKSQLYLYGNVYDAYYFAPNFREAQANGAKLAWAKFNDMRSLLSRYLRSEGYEVVCYHDLLDGFEVELEGGLAGAEARERLLPFLMEESPRTPALLGSRPLEAIEQSLGDTLSLMRCLMANRRLPAAGILNFASRYSANPNALDESERRHFLKLLKSAQEARVFPAREGRRSLLILVCDRLADLPPWLLLDNPLTKSIAVPKPGRPERAHFFRVQQARFHPAAAPLGPEAAAAAAATTFCDLTDGFTSRELESLITISTVEQLGVDRVQRVIDLYKYGERESPWEKLESARVNAAETALRKRVLGQDEPIRRSVDIIRRARLGLGGADRSGGARSNRPKGVLFFAGPTGTGKTELAKALAALVFGEEAALLRFDMSEYNDVNSDVKLIGAPPGYVGYEEGGQLTRRVKERPFSVILFDEIEKAHPVVFDKFLQILDDGRLTDGRGETVYFGETLIVFTSNLGVYRLDEAGRRVENVSAADGYAQLSARILDEIRAFFTLRLGRPEILNRFGDNFAIFDFIRPPVDRQILEKALGTVAATLRDQRRCEVIFSAAFIDDFVRLLLRDNLPSGGRGIHNRVETHIMNGIANFFFECGRDSDFTFEATIEEQRGGPWPARVRFRSR